MSKKIRKIFGYSSEDGQCKLCIVVWRIWRRNFVL